MKTTTLIQAAAIAAFAFTTFAASAATQDVQKLPRVVVTGKAVKEVAQLPRVVVNGVSEATLLRQQNLAAAAAARRV